MTVSADDDGKALSVVSAIDEWRKSFEGDPGVEVSAVKAMCRQWDGNRDDVLLRILYSIKAASERSRLAFLEALKENVTSEYLLVRRIEVLVRLQAWLRDTMSGGNTTETAIAWIIGFLWYEFDHETIWESIQGAPEQAIHAMLHEIEIEDYYANELFYEPADVAALVMLTEKTSDNALRLKLLDLLAELDSVDAVNALVRFKYEPRDEPKRGWQATAVLESQARQVEQSL